MLREPGPDGRFETDEGFAARVAPPLELLWIRRAGRVAGFVFIPNQVTLRAVITEALQRQQ